MTCWRLYIIVVLSDFIDFVRMSFCYKNDRSEYIRCLLNIKMSERRRPTSHCFKPVGCSH